MKLLNMDQKIIVPINDERIGATYELQTTIEEFFKKFLDEFTPEIIDAIPVEWLEKHLENEHGYEYSVKGILSVWKEEEK